MGYPINNSFFYKDFTPSRGFLQTNIYPSEGSPLASGSFPWRKNGKNADALCDGIGLGLLSKNSPSKRRIVKEDIPDNKAFFSCVMGCAKSHLKWAEAFTDSSCFLVSVSSFVGLVLLRFKSNEENRWYIFHPHCGLSVLQSNFPTKISPLPGVF